MDQLFSNKLSEQSFEIPKAFLADLNSKLDALTAAKKKGFPLFWSSLIVVLLGGSVLTYWLWPTEGLKIDSKTIEVGQQNVDSKSLIAPIDISNDSVLQKLEEENENVALAMSVDTSSTDINHYTSPGHNSSKKQDAALYFKKTTQSNDKKGTKNDTHQSSSDSKQKSANPNYLDKDENKESKNPLDVIQPNQNDGAISATIGINASPEKLDDSKDDKTSKLDTSVHKITIPSASDNAPIDSSLTALLVELDSAPSNTINGLDEDASIMPRNKRFEAQMNVGVALVKTTLQSTNTQFLTSVVDREQKLISPDFGVSFNYWINKISLGAGAHYYQTGEKVNYQTYQYNTYDSLVSVTFDSIYFDSVINNYDTLSITVNQMLTFTDTLSDYHNGINRYQWISIPLSFGYRFNFNSWSIIPKVSLNVEVGLRNQPGTYLTSDVTQFTPYDAIKLGFSYALQCEIRKEINDWHVFVSPYYRSSFSSTIVGDNWEKRYQNYGLNLGVGFKF